MTTDRTVEGQYAAEGYPGLVAKFEALVRRCRPDGEPPTVRDVREYLGLPRSRLVCTCSAPLDVMPCTCWTEEFQTNRAPVDEPRDERACGHCFPGRLRWVCRVCCRVVGGGLAALAIPPCLQKELRRTVSQVDGLRWAPVGLGS